MNLEFKVLHLFCGIGGGALGFARARANVRGLSGKYRTIGAVDIDAAACVDFETLTGTPATCADVAQMTPNELRAACGGEAPDVIFTSPPCKGFSGLLAKAKAEGPKYQALNRLVLQGLWLALETWPSSPPRLILLENVPLIQQRGADLLRQLRGLLSRYGYRIDERTHDCGELGGLAQHRRRYLLAARHEAQLPTFVYTPPRERVRAIGEVLGALPLPGDPAAGPMHQLPKLKPITWVRLALIPAGGDWRALGTRTSEPYRGHLGIVPWDAPLGTVCGRSRPGNGAFSVADPRSGGVRFNNVLRVVNWTEASVAVTGGTGPSAGGLTVADPRFTHSESAHRNKFRVERWTMPTATVIGASRVGSGALSVADPRLASGSRPDLLGILRWDRPAKTISGHASVSGSNCPAAVADPREAATENVPVIIAEDGTWHRPLTTLELAALQSFPTTINGQPLQLQGTSHTAWRERIGNAVPPDSAQAMAQAFLESLLLAASGATFTLGGSGCWVGPSADGRFEVKCAFALSLEQER